MSLAIDENRAAVKYTRRVQLLRVLWILGRALFQLTPRPCFALRRFILRCFGAKIGQQVNLYPSTHIYFPWNLTIGDFSSIGEWALVYNLGKVTIGTHATISQRVHLCGGTHDYRQAAMPLLKLPITIGNNTWICADAFIGPNITIGDGSIVGARAVAMQDVAPWTIVAGNPATFIETRPPL
jgi:putative colanic acid biosynthesis acetyltransferase WcaF